MPFGPERSRPSTRRRRRRSDGIRAKIAVRSRSRVRTVRIGQNGHRRRRDRGGRVDLGWVIDAYLLPLSALVLLGGAFGDRFGRRRIFALGIGLFGLSSAACAAAPRLEILIVGRVAQGLGAAMLMPNSLAILSEAFEGPARGRAIGAWAAIGAAAAGLGPVLGGWLIDAVGWRSIFLVNLPIAGAALFLSRFVRLTSIDATRTIDWLGGLLATTGLCLLTSALVLGSGTSG